MPEEVDYTPRPARRGQREKDDRQRRDEPLDYAPRPARQGRAAATEGNEHSSRPPRREREETDYTPRPSRRSREHQPSFWQRRQKRREGRPKRQEKRFFGSLLFWRLAAVVGVIVLVVPTVLVALTQNGEQLPQDPELAGLLATLEARPEDLATLIELGNYYFELGVPLWDAGEGKKALAAFEAGAGYYERALRQDPANSDVRTDLGTLYYYQGQLRDDPTLIDRAIQEWQLALSYEPDKPEALYNLGIGFLERGEVSQAVAMWQRVIEVAPGSENARQAQQMIEQYGGQP